jgi:hypothetical protein
MAMLEHEYLYFRFHDIMTSEIFANNVDKMLLKYINIKDVYMSASFRAWIEFFDNVKKITKRNSANVMSSDGNPLNTPENKLYTVIYKLINKKYPEFFSDPEWLEINSNMYYVDGVQMLTRDELLKDNIIDRDRVLFEILPHTVLFICDRGVSHELVRHRPAAFAQESTRYCNYTKDKFDNQIVVIEPCFWPDHNSIKYRLWKNSCDTAESTYFDLLNDGATPQEARSVLPNSLKTEIFITATEREWKHILNLRYAGVTGAPHPQMVEVMTIAYPQLIVASEDRLKIKKTK